MSARRYHAAFSNGEHRSRGSNAIYSHAWLVCWYRTDANGQKHPWSESGFCQTGTLARKRAEIVRRRAERTALPALADRDAQLLAPGVVTFLEVVPVRAT